MAPAAVALLALTLAPEVHAESRLVPYAFYGSLEAADIASTRVGIQHGGHEGNAIAAQPVKLLAAVLLAEGDHYLDRMGHRRAKWASRIVLGIAYAAAVRHNLRVGR